MTFYKKYLPKTLFGRALLIIVLPITIMQIAVVYIFFNAHWATVTASLSDSVAADVSLAVELYNQAPGPQTAEQLNAMMKPHMELSVGLRDDNAFLTARRRAFFSVLDKTLQRSLSQSLEQPFWFDTTRYPNHIDIRVKVDDGTLTFVAARERVFARTGFVFIFWLALASLLLTLISIIFIRNQARPITRLASAAEAYGKGQDIANFKPSGATEVRLAGQSFLKMRQRISRFMEQRTTMLAGVSHDLRTPLTRLNLHLALQDDTEENRAALSDLKEMENMLNGYLDFARGLSDEETVRIKLKPFLESVLEKHSGSRLEFIMKKDLSADLKPLMMTRAIENFLSNANKYGDRIQVSVHLQKPNIIISIEDDGPGISEAHYRDVFRPFFRLDTARNQNVEGTGLGLSIARDIVRNHGGKIELGESQFGGLKVDIYLPT
ncbi:MAG: HAMP domain-containing protein [Hellea sp.]|nr:HAMP domain-containing protein [Hellea sp.]